MMATIQNTLQRWLVDPARFHCWVDVLAENDNGSSCNTGEGAEDNFCPLPEGSLLSYY